MPRKKNNDLLSQVGILPNLKKINGKPYAIVTYRDASGKQKFLTRRVDTVAEWSAAVADLRQEAERRTYVKVDISKVTFSELLTEYKKAKPNAPKWYLDPLDSFFGPRRIKTITYGDIEQFKASRLAVKKTIPDPNDPKKKIVVDRKITTINRELEFLRTVLLYAVRQEWLQRTPFTRGPSPIIQKSQEESRYRIPSIEEEEKILAVCVDKRAHLRPILLMAKDTGLRRGALLSLLWSSVVFVDGHVGRLMKIPQGNRYKRRPKLIGITTRLQAALAELWEASDKNLNAKIFGGIKDIKRSYATACRLADVSDLHFHDWRHGYVTDMAEAGVENRIAQAAAGHTSEEMHAIYTNVDERIAIEIAERLDGLHERRREKTKKEREDK
jgi:integrase